MEDYRFTTKEAMNTTSDTMDYFLSSRIHFYAIFDSDAKVIYEDGSYADVENGDGKIYEVHAGGDGDFFSHKITFELIKIV